MGVELKVGRIDPDGRREPIPLGALILSILFVVMLFCAVQSARGDEPPAALPPGYDAVAKRCQDTGKAMIVWVGVRGRVVSGAVGLECQTFPNVRGPGLVVGVWHGDTFARRDLPATADDATIRGACSGSLAAHRPCDARPCCQRCGSGCQCGPTCGCDDIDAGRAQSGEPPYAAPAPLRFVPAPTYQQPAYGGYRADCYGST